MATKYKVYEVDASDWTPEMELKHDYVKVLNGKVYFVSRSKVDYARVVEKVPDSLGAWLLDCEVELLANANNKKHLKNLAKAKEQFTADFEEGLKKALDEYNAEQNNDEP